MKEGRTNEKIWLPEKEVLRGFIKLFSGATLGQLIPFFAGPILARLYSPEDFGLFAILSSTSAILSIASTGAFEYAILTTDDEKEASDLALFSSMLAFIFSLLTCVILLLIILLCRPWLHNSYGWAWLLIPVFIFLQGITNAANNSHNREEHYGKMAKGKLIRSVIMSLSQVFLGLLNLRWGLFPGQLVGNGASAIYLFYGVKKKFINAFQLFSLANFRNLAKKYYRFPRFMVPSQMLNELSVQVPVYFLELFFSTAVVGVYALPQKLLNVPVSLIGSSIGQVYFREAAKHKNNAEALSKTTLALFRFLFRIGVVPFSVILVFGDVIFPWLFGSEWQQSGYFAQMLSPWLLFVLSGSPISKLFAVLEKQKTGLWFNITLIALRVSALLAGGLIFKSEMIAVLLFSITGFAYWFYQSFYILRMAKIKIAPIVFEIITILFIVIIPMVIARVCLIN